jgi:hypothetical protein
VRLDHLLSKERLTSCSSSPVGGGGGSGATRGPSVPVVVLMGGTSPRSRCLPSRLLPGVGVGTLLGPEGTSGPPLWGVLVVSGRSIGCIAYRFLPLVVRLPCLGGWWGCGGGWVCRVGGCRVVFENWIVVASDSSFACVFFCWVCGVFVRCGQVVKGARWMPWHQEPMKDVGGCVKPRGAANRALIRGCPNGGTRQQSCAVTSA